MSLDVYIPRRFHPPHSLLGRWLQRRLGDARQAEAVYYLVLTGIALGLVLLQYLTWAVFEAPIRGNPSLARAYGLGTFAVLGVVVGTCLVGWKPPIRVRVAGRALLIRQGRRLVRVPLQTIETVACIPALRYHRHERRYAATRSFVNRLEPELLLIRTCGGPVVLSLPAPERARLHALLLRGREVARSVVLTSA